LTLKLCGFSASNYYNKIKLQLLEKGVAFEEDLVWTGQAQAALIERSPLGKVPFLETPDGPISESMACAEYIEAVYPQKALLPTDPFAAAKVRELIIYSELHLELVARQLYAEAFFWRQSDVCPSGQIGPADYPAWFNAGPARRPDSRCWSACL
jgi:glutathione S-transferase